MNALNDAMLKIEFETARHSIDEEGRLVKEVNAQLAPNLNREDVSMILRSQKRTPLENLMKSYVSNWEELSLKQKMKVMNFVQAQRSAHAKEIFLKELSAIGRKLKKNNGAVKGLSLKHRND